MAPGRARYRIAANLGLGVTQLEAGEILGESLVKPILGRGIVEAQKQPCKIVGDGPPAVLCGKIEHDIVAVSAGQKKSWGGNGPALAERRHTNVFLIRLQSDHIQRFRHLHFGLQEELAKDFAHLFQAQAYFAAFFLAPVGEHGKMSGAYADPLGFRIARESVGGGCNREEQDRGWKASRAEGNTGHVRPG